MYGKDLSSLKSILYLGLCFFIRLASRRRASLSLLVVVVSRLCVNDNILSVRMGRFESVT